MRALALLLALLFAPQVALANVAAFPETALRGDREISEIRARAFARQPAEARPENAHFYGESTSGIVDDPINHRDPTGAFLDIAIVAAMYGPRAAAGYAARIGQHLLSAGVNSVKSLFGVSGTIMDAVLGDPLRPRTALDEDGAGFLERLNPLNQAGRSAIAAGQSSGFDQGVQIADSAMGVVNAGLLAMSGARAITSGVASLSPQFEMTGVLDGVAQEMSGTMPSQFPSPAMGAARAALLGSEGGSPNAAVIGSEGSFGPGRGLGRAPGTTRLGVRRTNAADWRALRDLWDTTGDGAILSPANRAKIASGQTPVVDSAWVQYFPGDAALVGEQIPMHHIMGSPIAVPLPETRHLDAHMPGGFRRNPGGPGTSG